MPLVEDMPIAIDLSKTLADLMDIAPSGFAIGLQIRFATPTFMFQTYTRDWVEEYSRGGLVARDPTVAWGFSHEGIVDWKDLEPLDEAHVLARARERGLVHGTTVSMLRDGSRSIGSFARSDRYFSPAEIERIEAGLVALHDATASVRSLSPELRESLRRLSVAFAHP